MVEFGQFRLDLIDDGRFELKSDAFTKLGGKLHKTAAAPRVLISFNSLLIRGNGHTILVDPGTGDKLLSDAYRTYRLEWPRKVFGELERLGVGRSEIDIVILTHLHWDHCGASTSVDEKGDLLPTFPNARYVVRREEVDEARRLIAEGDDGYIAEDFEPLLRAGVLEQLDRDSEIVPGIKLEKVGGHSPGLQIVEIEAGDGRHAVYLTDLVPTAAQLALDSAMSYDVNVPELVASKQRVLDRVAERGDLLLFVHGPRTKAGFLKKIGDRDYDFERVDI